MNLETKIRCTCGKERNLYEFLIAQGYKPSELTANFLKYAPKVRSMLPKLVCVNCNRKGQISPVYKSKNQSTKSKRISFSDKLVATDNGLDRIFHKQSCSKAKIIRRENEVFFENREIAIKRHFAPCKRCRP